MSGPRYDANWLDAAETLDFFDASGSLSGALARLGLTVTFEPIDDPMFHPGRSASVFVPDPTGEPTSVGVVGELHPNVRDAFDLRGDTVAYFELRLDALLVLLRMASARKTVSSRCPGSRRPTGIWRCWFRQMFPPVGFGT